MRKSLVLRRETLTELSSGDLAGVNGGSHLCATDTIGHTRSFDVNCPTMPINVCLDELTSAIAINTLDGCVKSLNC